MNGQWNWLIGRKLSLGEVVDVFGESATVRHGDDETRVLLCELLEEDYKEHDRYDAALNEAWNSGDGSYLMHLLTLAKRFATMGLNQP